MPHFAGAKETSRTATLMLTLIEEVRSFWP
jgi:hypothetical protein